MISYCWENKEVVLKLKEQLHKTGIKTWFDEENMPSESILTGMADAVEGAALMLLCYSAPYKRSANCRMEAEYGHKIGKKNLFIRVQPQYKPDGWLGLLLGNNLYYDISGEMFERNCSRVIQEIMRKLEKSPNNKGVKSTIPRGVAQRNDATMSGQAERVRPLQSSKPDPKWKSWSSEEVQCWLKDMKMDFLMNEYENFFLISIATFL